MTTVTTPILKQHEKPNCEMSSEVQKSSRSYGKLWAIMCKLLHAGAERMLPQMKGKVTIWNENSSHLSYIVVLVLAILACSLPSNVVCRIYLDNL